MGFKVGLLGLGTVGTGVAAIFQDCEERHPLLQSLELHRVGLRSPSKPCTINLPPDSITTDPEIDIVVEVIGGIEPARSLILKAIL